MKLVLIGLRGSGKSTVGPLLAKQLGWTFVDTDGIIQRRTGMTIREIFDQGGEALFRKIEAEVVQECARGDQLVLATGGGAILNRDSAAALKKDGFVVHLSADPAELWRRVSCDDASAATRPQLVAATSGIEELQKLLLARAEIYASVRDVEVHCGGRSPQEVANAILALLRERGKNHMPGQ
ncbi:MAG TPA: shikimate kinase [Planctomycetota bacterium]